MVKYVTGGKVWRRKVGGGGGGSPTVLQGSDTVLGPYSNSGEDEYLSIVEDLLCSHNHILMYSRRQYSFNDCCDRFIS